MSARGIDEGPGSNNGGRMQYKSLEIKIGFTVFIAILTLTIGLMWFQGFQISRETYRIYASFPMALGATAGDKVYLNGVEMGKIKEVQLRKRDVLVTIELSAKAKVPDDSQILLQTIGIMGDRIVTIVLGSSDHYLAPGSVMQGVYDPGVAEALASLGSIMGQLTQLTKDMQRVSTILTQGDKLKRTIENLAELTDQLNKFMKDDRPDLEAGLRSFRRSADRIDGLLSRNETHIDTILSSYATIGRDLPGLVKQAAELADTLTQISSRLNRNDNTLGALMNDRTLIDSVDKTVKSLDDLIADIKAHPKKYVKLSIF
jgi:phospholipid/cholesterol/gamma-HCH transport system substrate-binding protein